MKMEKVRAAVVLRMASINRWWPTECKDNFDEYVWAVSTIVGVPQEDIMQMDMVDFGKLVGQAAADISAESLFIQPLEDTEDTDGDQ